MFLGAIFFWSFLFVDDGYSMMTHEVSPHVPAGILFYVECCGYKPVVAYHKTFFDGDAAAESDYKYSHR